ncbi:metacaspase-1-like [Mercurialis annua]|uniref:metacaspase-1-like n=1 Tax=Mercurialis annua TaxID=3986 RepID=UPI0021603F06|nr:metacaspase-1-like [Mercurialis annua]
MSSSDMNRSLVLRDAKGYTCSKCRQRFPPNLNLSEFQCPACQRVSTTSSPMRINQRSSDTKDNYRVFQVVEKFKKMVSGTKQESDPDSDKFMSLNCHPSLVKRARASTAPRKRALLIGVTYAKWKHRLKGTVNDVKNIRKLLMEIYRFQKDDILVLTEEETMAEFIPTKDNIIKSLNWLVEDCREGDSLVFYFSGHGLRQPDFNNDEQDGYDETICPVDFMEQGMILDNYINAAIVHPLPKGVTLHAIVDACHSGTVLDLVHVYDRTRKKWKNNSPPNGSRKHTNGGLAICISACEDSQMAADTTAVSGKGMNGALTYILIEIVRKYPGPTYGDLIDMIQETIDAVNNSGCLPVKIIRSVLQNRLLQNPLLSASEVFDVKKKHFIM